MPRSVQGLRHVVIGRQPQAEGTERRIKAFIERHPREGIQPVGAGLRARGHHPGQQVFGKGAARFPFVERVGVMCEEESALFGACLTLEHHGRGEAAQE